jgi:hypothetical protein
MLEDLKRPEYVHVLLNPIPLYGLVLATLALAIALAIRSRQAQTVALILVIVGCGAAFPVIEFGERAYDRVYAMSNPDGQQWLDTHMFRAERCEFVFYVTGAFALATLVAFWKFQKAATPLLIAVLILTLISVVSAGWISYAGGKVRHTEFRDGPPPRPPPHKEHHD